MGKVIALEELAESITDVFFAFDEKLRYTYWNKASRELTGISAEDALGKHLYDLFPNTDATRRAEEAYLKVLTTKQPQHFVNEYQLGSKDYVFEISAYPLRDGLSVFVKDITERKRLEKALRERTHSLGERVKELSCLYGISSLIEKQNISSEEIFQGTVDLIPPAWQYPEVTCARIILEGQEFQTDNFKETIWKQTSDIVVHGDRIGTLEVCYLEERPRMDEGPFLKEERSLINTIAKELRNNIERKQAEEQELRKFKTISDRAGYGAAVSRPDGNLVYVNQSFAKMHGYTVEELIGKHLSIFHTEEQMQLVERLRKQLIQTGSYVAQEVWHKRKDGTVFPTSMTGAAIIDDKGKPLYLCATAIDITERKRLRANMEFYLSQVTRAQEEERKRIAREIHDESIQSLATLALGIDAIARGKEKLSKDVIQRLEGLRAEANSILDGLRRFSHELRPGVIDQVGLVPALEILTEELNKENRVKSSLEIRGSERRPMPETELALFRIAQEALRNVRRHSRATEAVIMLEFTRGKVRLIVHDNGTGFELPDMLSDFATEGKLGFIGMQERIRLLDGKLSVKSRVGRGTTLVVEVADRQGMKG